MYDLIWIAHFKDGSILYQYDKNEQEILFKEVLAKQDDLMRFTLLNHKSREYYSVDLTTGCMQFSKDSGQLLPLREDMVRSDTYKYRLIYFREVTRNFGSTMNEIGVPLYTFFLGFQYTDEDNKNHKRVMKINVNGQWTVN
jgi:hypothetical protein